MTSVVTPFLLNIARSNLKKSKIELQTNFMNGCYVKNLIMAESLEYFRNELLTYYPDYLLHADFTDGGKLLLLAKPFVDLDMVM